MREASWMWEQKTNKHKEQENETLLLLKPLSFWTLYSAESNHGFS